MHSRELIGEARFNLLRSALEGQLDLVDALETRHETIVEGVEVGVEWLELRLARLALLHPRQDPRTYVSSPGSVSLGLGRRSRRETKEEKERQQKLTGGEATIRFMYS